MSGPAGTARWNGDDPPSWQHDEGEVRTGSPPGTPGDLPPAEGIDGALADFVTALRTGRTPWGEIHDNLASLAMVHAATEAAETGTRVSVRQVLDRAGAVARSRT